MLNMIFFIPKYIVRYTFWKCLATESISLFPYIIFTINTLRKNNHHYSFFNIYFCNNAITSSGKCSPLRYFTKASAIVSAPSYVLSAYADTPLMKFSLTSSSNRRNIPNVEPPPKIVYRST